MQTVISTAVFPIFFVQVAAVGRTEAQGTEALGYANTAAAVLIAVLAPILGAIADFKAAKKRFLVGFMLLGVTASACMFFIAHGQLLFASILFILSMAGASGRSRQVRSTIAESIADPRPRPRSLPPWRPSAPRASDPSAG